MDAARSIDCAIYTNTQPSQNILPKFGSWPAQTIRTSDGRRQATLHDQPIAFHELAAEARGSRCSSLTFLYLAYGSNLSAETFRGKRDIKPLSQINVVVPEISLTFDLPGIPYREPCFGNCRYRAAEEQACQDAGTPDYHKDHWKKGLVGVVYEVTAADYAHIIATEGGGSGYQDVIVQCYPLDEDPTCQVPLKPLTAAFKAHTLFSPRTTRSRPDSSYAQPSARYKKLITDGAAEHNLPYEYREYLDNLRTYRITTLKQKVGQAMFLALWGPIIAFIVLGGSRIVAGKDGRYPQWYSRIIAMVFAACWNSYDSNFKPAFGDGERTIGEELISRVGRLPGQQEEKTALIQMSKVEEATDHIV